mmetsp:Transcript_44440/g.117481  ORF Transcript_44440/g.117481 Transcript_44440/m.117481 type:complete len:301 (+) Transcript_44440:436-1338(+)
MDRSVALHVWAQVVQEELQVPLHALHPAVHHLELLIHVDKLPVHAVELLHVLAVVFALAVVVLVHPLAPHDVVLCRTVVRRVLLLAFSSRGDAAALVLVHHRLPVHANARRQAARNRPSVDEAFRGLWRGVAVGGAGVHLCPETGGPLHGHQIGGVRHRLLPGALPQHQVAHGQDHEQPQHCDAGGKLAGVQQQRPHRDAYAHHREVHLRLALQDPEPQPRLQHPLQADLRPVVVEVLLRLGHDCIVCLGVHGDEQVQHADAEDHRAAEEEPGGQPALDAGLLVPQTEHEVDAVAVPEEQ